MTTRLTHIEALFKALADATRLRILALLVAGEVCVCELHGALKLPQPTVSRHLALTAALGAGRHPARWAVGALPARAPGRHRVCVHFTEIVTHALSHVDTIVKDGDRLRKATGCCLKATDAPRGLACCEEVVA